MNHKDLEVWKRSIELTTQIYKVTENLPAEEKYGLSSQLKRAAVSIPSNIAEGAARNSTKELVRFLDIATGSLSELETQLIIVERLNFLRTKEIVENEILILNKMLYKLKHSLKNKL